MTQGAQRPDENRSAAQAEIERLKQALSREHDMHLRALADFDNYQKRARRDQERYREDATRDLLKELILDVNHGHIMVGASSVPIDASSVVELRNIRAFTPRGNVIPIPLVGNTTEQSLEFSIEATSELLINRVPVGVRADRLRVVIQVASVIAMLIGALAGLVTLLTWIRVTRKGSLQVPPGSI